MRTETNEFTVIGDVVNVANRVSDVCKDLKKIMLHGIIK